MCTDCLARPDQAGLAATNSWVSILSSIPPHPKTKPETVSFPPSRRHHLGTVRSSLCESITNASKTGRILRSDPFVPSGRMRPCPDDTSAFRMSVPLLPPHECRATLISGTPASHKEGRQTARAHFLNVAVLPALSECMRLAALGPSSEFIRAAYGSNAGLFLLPAGLSCRVLPSMARCAWSTDWAWV